jgi:cyclohexadieny/prephenate dehydrogenase
MAEPIFSRVAIVGIGLIGSSIARAVRENNLARHIAIADASEAHRALAQELGLGESVHGDAAEAVKDADLVMLCVPLGANAAVAAHISAALKTGAIVSDVGSCKQAVIRDVAPHLPPGVHLVPGHPVAGTEHSGPKAGFAALFRNRWCILTPEAGTDAAAVEKMKAFWGAFGSKVELMEPRHHDLVLAITSHVPHLIAYNIVGTADDLEAVTESEVIKYSAGGFRDFTRIAASDPTMWRDVFLNNKEAVLEMLGRFTEDLIALQRSIRWGEGEELFNLFTRTRAIRRAIIDAGQETAAPDFGRQSPDQGAEVSDPAKPTAG